VAPEPTENRSPKERKGRRGVGALSVCMRGSNERVVTLEARPVVVDVIEVGAQSLVPAGNHGAHAKALATVAVQSVGKKLGGGGDGDTLALLELVHTCLEGKVALPVGAVRGT
jgi:hypothetical protein